MKIREMNDEIQRYKQEAQQASASLASQLHNRMKSGLSYNSNSKAKSVTPSPSAGPQAQVQVSAVPVDQKTKRVKKGVSVKRSHRHMSGNQCKYMKGEPVSIEKALAVCLMEDGDCCGLSQYPFLFIPSLLEKSTSMPDQVSESMRIYNELLYSLSKLHNDEITIFFFIESLIRHLISLAFIIDARDKSMPNQTSNLNTKSTEEEKDLHRPSSSLSSSSNNKQTKMRKNSGASRTNSNTQQTSKRVEGRSGHGASEIETTSLLILRVLKIAVKFSNEARRCFCQLLSPSIVFSTNIDCFKGKINVRSALNHALREMMEFTSICDKTIQPECGAKYVSKEELSDLSINIIGAISTFALGSFDWRSIPRSKFHIKSQLQFESLSIIESVAFNYYTGEMREALNKQLSKIFLPPEDLIEMDVPDGINGEAFRAAYNKHHSSDVVTVLDICLNSGLANDTNSKVVSVLLSLLVSLSKSGHFLTEFLTIYGDRMFTLLVDVLEGLVRSNKFHDNSGSAMSASQVLADYNYMAVVFDIIRFIKTSCESEAGIVQLVKGRVSRSTKLLTQKRKRSGIAILSELFYQVACDVLELSYITCSKANEAKLIGAQLLRDIIMFFSIAMPYMPSSNGSDDSNNVSILSEYKDIIRSTLNMVATSPNGLLIDQSTRYESRLLMDEIDEQRSK